MNMDEKDDQSLETPESLETLERIRQQFDRAPYPRVPLERSPKENYNDLFTHSLVTSHYLRHQKFVETEGKIILDVGCGSGYTSLTLAFANPGAQIIGIDLSAESIKLSRDRLKHYGFDNVEFHVLPLDDAPQLGLAFDYINCDEVLYLLPDPAASLQVMKSLLKPQGIIRANLHSALQREGYYRAQAMFKMLGLMNDNPGEFEAGVTIEIMQALKDDVSLKARSWKALYAQPENEASIMMNYLLMGDKGFTIADLFELLRTADLDFVSMVNWRQWEVTDLFKDADNLPAFLGMSLMGAAIEDQLRLYELLNPIHRLIDFWCAPADETIAKVPVEAWTDADWQGAIVHLHPQVQVDAIRAALMSCEAEGSLLQISNFISLSTLGPVFIDSTMAICLLPLFEGGQPFTALVDRYLKVRPLNSVTLEPTDPIAAFNTVKQLLNRLESFLYVLIERSNEEP
jgi:2-polyprenyl-3-methyl-5-hydroxy-6-metoxy-1,4-benzoquinol methylase